MINRTLQRAQLREGAVPTIFSLHQHLQVVMITSEMLGIMKLTLRPTEWCSYYICLSLFDLFLLFAQENQTATEENQHKNY